MAGFQPMMVHLCALSFVLLPRAHIQISDCFISPPLSSRAHSQERRLEPRTILLLYFLVYAFCTYSHLLFEFKSVQEHNFTFVNCQGSYSADALVIGFITQIIYIVRYQISKDKAGRFQHCCPDSHKNYHGVWILVVQHGISQFEIEEQKIKIRIKLKVADLGIKIK